MGADLKMAGGGRQRIHIRHPFSYAPSAAMLLVGKNGCVPKDFNQKHAGCRETSGVFCCERGSRFKVQGSGLRWRLRRILDDDILVSSAFLAGKAIKLRKSLAT